MISVRILSMCSLLLFSFSSHTPVWADNGLSGDRAGEKRLAYLDEVVEKDVQQIAVCRQGLDHLMAFASSRVDLFPQYRRQTYRMLTRAEKGALRSTWQSFLDYCLALASVEAAHSDFFKINDRDMRKRSFYVHYAAFLAQYHYAMAFLEITDSDPTFDVLLNEAHGDIGLPEKTFAAFKFRFLNVAAASRFVALNAIAAHYGPTHREVLIAAIDADKAFVWQTGKGKGERLTLNNALTIAKRTGFSAWLPVQKGISEWMGDTKVWRKERSLISEEQIRELLETLQPGDILFERREWYLSNVGLPGFWPHVALYVGTSEERRAYFEDDPELCGWLEGQDGDGCDIEKVLQKSASDAYTHALAPQEHGHLPRVIEAISEGVSFTTLEHSAACDSLAVLRPRLSKTEKALAILRAFDYHGRPYDFNFDFLTDASLVCSELIYKSYEKSYQPAHTSQGLRLPVVDMMGRKLTPPNEIVRQFDENFATSDQQMDLVLFLDGKEALQRAEPASIDAFRNSWRRPKWHIFIQDTEQ